MTPAAHANPFDRARHRSALAVSIAAAFAALFGMTIGGRLSAAPQPAASAVALQPGTLIVREISGRDEHLYQLALDAGQYAGLTVEQRGIDVVVRVSDSAGAPILEVDSESRPHGEERAGIVAPAGGSYQITVRPRYVRGAAGTYEIRLGEVRQATDRDRDLFDAHRLSTESASLDAQGKYGEAKERAARALELAERSVGPTDAYVGDLLVKLGDIDRTTGDSAAAARVLERARAVYAATIGRDSLQYAYATQRLGALYINTEDYAKAEPLLSEALAGTERSLGPAHPRVATSLMIVSLLHTQRLDYDRGVPELERALKIAEATLEPTDFALLAIENNLGDIYALLDDERGEPLLTRALEGLEKLYGPSHPRLATPLQNLGAIAREKKDYPRALALLWRAEGIREATLGPRHSLTATLLLNIGNVYSDQHDYARAKESFSRALDVLETAAGPYHTYTIDALSSLARVSTADGEIAQALDYQAQVDRIVEKNIGLNLTLGAEREKLAYFASTMERTHRTISLNVLAGAGNTTATALAATVIEQRKGRVLDAMAGSLAALRRRMNAGDSAVLDELSTTTTALAALALNGPGRTPFAEYQKRLATLEQDRDRLEAEVGSRSAEFRAQSQPITLSAIQAEIPADAALVEFAVYQPFDATASVKRSEQLGPPRYIAYILRRNGGPQWKELGPAEPIDRAVASLRGALRDPKRVDVTALARDVDRRVMQPIRPLLTDVSQLLVSPDGELNLIPFEALVNEDGHYLIERLAVTYLTAGRDLLRLQVPRRSQSAPVVVANPEFGDPDQTAPAGRAARPSRARGTTVRRSITTAGDLSHVYFAPLAGTAAEARAIKGLFPRARVLTGGDATKAALQRLNAPSILHIATHGFFLQEAGGTPPAASTSSGKSAVRAGGHAVAIANPLLRSGLALTGANSQARANDDGILTALEAANLNLWGTKLVTLSACDTGVGEVHSGEGVYGLRRAFVLAGAETLVMSLWPVSDYVTREMMDSYYRGLQRGQGRGEALRHAQLSMLKKPARRHPFYWASFIQAGEWAPLDGRRRPTP